MNPWPIAPLKPTKLGFTAKDYDFTDFTAKELNGTDNLLTAIDALLLDSAASIAAQVTLSSDLDADLADMSNQLAAMNNDDFDSLLGDLASAAGAGDTLAGAGDSQLPIGSFFNPNV